MHVCVPVRVCTCYYFYAHRCKPFWIFDSDRRVEKARINPRRIWIKSTDDLRFFENKGKRRRRFSMTYQASFHTVLENF